MQSICGMLKVTEYYSKKKVGMKNNSSKQERKERKEKGQKHLFLLKISLLSLSETDIQKAEVQIFLTSCPRLLS